MIPIFLLLPISVTLLYFSAAIKCRELRSKSRADLMNQLKELRDELQQLRVAKVTGGAASKLSKIKVIRKSIARCLTVLNQTQRVTRF